MLKNSLSFACQGFPVLLIASEGNKINTMSGKSKEKELLEFSHVAMRTNKTTVYCISYAFWLALQSMFTGISLLHFTNRKL